MATNAHSLNRRQFLKLAGAAGVGILLEGCRPQESLSTPNPTQTARPPALTHTQTPTSPPLPTATSSPTSSPVPSATPQPATPTPWPFNSVATARIQSYDASLIRSELERMLDSIGGFTGLIKPQARVGIKVNLTGGTWWDTPDKPPATELFATHPAVVGALCELLIDAGASRLVVLDGIGDETSFDAWGYTDMAAPLGVELLNLCKPDPYLGYDRFMVGPKGQIYSQFFLNQSLRELDMLISVAKLKCHSIAGVTLALKNLVGLAPISEYRLDPQHNNRSSFHGSSDFDTRLPRVIVDLNLACLVHFAIIDGIVTAEGGAGPWDQGLAQVRPGLLIAGRDAVAVDAVAAAAMGFDPEAASGNMPFVHCENHLALAHEAGLGTNALNDIPISGPPVDEIRFVFKSAG